MQTWKESLASAVTDGGVATVVISLDGADAFESMISLQINMRNILH